MKQISKLKQIAAALLLFLTLSIFSGHAQESGLIGREFYFAAWPNLDVGALHTENITLEIFPYDNGLVTIGGTSVSVTKNNPLRRKVLLNGYDGVTNNNSLLITSTVDIVVYAGILGEDMGSGYSSADATAILPVKSLGQEYRLFQYPSAAKLINYDPVQYRVIATRDGTNVYLNKNTLLASGLKAGEVFVGKGTTDLTGSLITANNPIAVFSGSRGSQYLSYNDATDVTLEQMWPISTWGREYVLAQVGTTTNNCRVMSNDAPVNVIVKRVAKSDTILSIPAGGFREFLFENLAQITSDKPVAVAQYTTGIDNPSMMWVNPIGQRVENAKLARLTVKQPINQSSWAAELIVLTRAQDTYLSSLKLNNSSSPSPTSSATFSGWTINRYVMPNDGDWMEISNQNGFVAIMNEYGASKSSIYAAAGGTLNLNAYFTIETKTYPRNPVHHTATKQETHTFNPGDTLVLERKIDRVISSVEWKINGTTVPASSFYLNENPSMQNHTVKIQASLLAGGQNTVDMYVRYSNGTDSTYTGNVWRSKQGHFKISKTISDCVRSNSAPAFITTTIDNTGAENIGAQTGIAMNDTIPAGFTVTGNPVSVPLGAATLIPPIETLSGGRKVYKYTMNINANEKVTVTYNGDFSKQDSTQSITTSAGIDPAGLSLSGFIVSPDSLYVTLTDSVKSIILDTPNTKEIKYTVGIPETFKVKPDPRATFIWSYSTNNGAWTYETGVQTNSYNPPSFLFNVAQNIRVRCQAGWSASCTDEVIYTLTPDRIFIPVNPHIRGFFIK